MKRYDRDAYETTLDVEGPNGSAEYVVTYRVTPYERERGPSYDCGGTPASGGDVEDVEVWHETTKRCQAHRYVKMVPCRECKVVREARPELVALVDEDALERHADDVSESAAEDAAEARAEMRREAREDR